MPIKLPHIFSSPPPTSRAHLLMVRDPRRKHCPEIYETRKMRKKSANPNPDHEAILYLICEKPEFSPSQCFTADIVKHDATVLFGSAFAH